MVFSCLAALGSCVLLFFVTFTPAVCDELLFVQALWRHGDRSPVHTIPTDKENGPVTWKNGLGELTETGIRDAYHLGKLLRLRYRDFLDPCALHRQIHLRSTDYNRTLMSAIAAHAGMLNNSCLMDASARNAHLLSRWSPLPVHTTPSRDDYLLDQPCPKGNRLLDSYWDASPTVATHNQNYKPFFDFVSNSTGWTINLANISRVFDYLRITRLHRPHKLPGWANETVINVTEFLSRVAWIEQFNYLPATRLFKGHLLFHIADLFAQKIANNSNYVRALKFEGYSVHDSTLVMLLVLLGAYKFRSFSMPSYSSCIAMELWKKDTQYYVKVFYRDGLDIFSELRVSECAEPPQLCMFEQFIDRSKPFFVENPRYECSDESIFMFLQNKMMDRSVHIVLLTLLLITLASCCVIFTALYANLWLKNKRRYKEYFTVRMDDMADGFFQKQNVSRFKDRDQQCGVSPDASEDDEDNT